MPFAAEEHTGINEETSRDVFTALEKLWAKETVTIWITSIYAVVLGSLCIFTYIIPFAFHYNLEDLGSAVPIL